MPKYDEPINTDPWKGYVERVSYALGIEERPAHANGFRSQAEGLQDIWYKVNLWQRI